MRLVYSFHSLLFLYCWETLVSKFILPSKLLSLPPWIWGGGGFLISSAAATACTYDTTKLWQWCICRIWFLRETGAMKCLKRAQDQMEFGIFTCRYVLHGFQLLCISSSVRLCVRLALQEQAQAEAGQGDGDTLRVGSGEGLHTVSKAKGTSHLKCSSMSLPDHLAWFMLNKSVIYARATCSST